jgi:hypothetical protein
MNCLYINWNEIEYFIVKEEVRDSKTLINKIVLNYILFLIIIFKQRKEVKKNNTKRRRRRKVKVEYYYFIQKKNRDYLREKATTLR